MAETTKDCEEGAVPVIAIDGPSASGKGTVAGKVAAALGFHFLDSGVLYRLVALSASQSRTPIDHEAGLAAIAAEMNVDFHGERILLGGMPANQLIRSEQCGRMASLVAALPAVRTALLARQRGFCRPPGLVADGRDMGSIVFPHAALKIFLTASPEARAERRHKQLMENGIDANITAILQDIGERDARDSARNVAPLQVARDALVVDSTGLSVAQVVAHVLALWRERSQR